MDDKEIKLKPQDEEYLKLHPEAKIIPLFDPFTGSTHVVLRTK